MSEKQPVDLEVISPANLAKKNNVSVGDMLAGEMLSHFGGFLDENLRTSDFDLGYSSTLDWLEDGGLAHHGLDEAANAQAKEAATTFYEPSEMWKEWGKTSVAKVAAHHPVALGALMAQITRVAVQDVITRKSHAQ